MLFGYWILLCVKCGYYMYYWLMCMLLNVFVCDIEVGFVVVLMEGGCLWFMMGVEIVLCDVLLIGV